MKVLMFGWEFPPHISGGLGTACLGLTRSLSAHKVKVLFVVPKLYGDETEKDARLINASAIRITPRKRLPNKSHGVSQPIVARAVGSEAKESRHAMSYLEIPAGLSPYESPRAGVRHEHSLSSWNYSFHARADVTHSSNATEETPPAAEPDTPSDHYDFTGTYGDNLLEEVKRYGTVGGIVAGKYSFDVIHAHDWMTFLAGIEAKRRTKKPLVVHVHSTEFDRAGEHINPEMFEIEKTGLHEADRVIAVSNWTKEILVSRYGVPAERVNVIHNGIGPKEEAGEFAFPDFASHFVTFLGRVTYQKGPRFFVDAAQKVLQEFPDAHFIVAGAGDLLPQMIERVAQLNMSSNFHFTGFLRGSQVDQIWSLTDVYVMPSVSEPFGIAPLEAIQSGVPVILSNQSGVAEVMPHAIKVDFWDVKALAGAICSVLRYESLSHVLRQNSKQHVQLLTWDKAACNVKALYHELAGKR
ncbi:MAG TPA: glycosyltransferase family 4 protein [Chryseosolibacter sp.]